MAEFLVVVIGMATNPKFDSLVLEHRWIAALATGLLQPILAWSIWFCHSREIMLLADDRKISKIISEVCFGQIALLALMLVALFFVVLSPRKNPAVLQKELSAGENF